MSSGRAWCLLLVLALPVLGGAATPIPAELKEALKPFRSEGSRGWAFTQTTRGEGKSQIETFDPALREFHRWVLIERDGRAPTPEDTQRYNELQTRRSTAPNAPNVKDQIDETDCELLSDDGIRIWATTGGGLAAAAEPGPVRTVVLDNWTNHSPATDTGIITVPGERTPTAAAVPVLIELEYFQGNGYAVLEFSLEPEVPFAPEKP